MGRSWSEVDEETQSTVRVTPAVLGNETRLPRPVTSRAEQPRYRNKEKWYSVNTPRKVLLLHSYVRVRGSGYSPSIASAELSRYSSCWINTMVLQPRAKLFTRSGLSIDLSLLWTHLSCPVKNYTFNLAITSSIAI